ncbi:radical SAM/SPASM domain-containing protein [[Clostridium] polysaccharolyticum]|uniref:Radical SAM superfamily enzyme, MoaA/NifB/PqqE/SkfB family n=1 Tax=[Clostridium] polysaccharolyticum TaxID=29364 RepID=A0A1I0DRH5_9FIRM|nr:radical SAM protein [[Clostridium] polysaccharolyticum]SET34782.1 Radical SAM superfamily enzyme, MoaA/NifB/PqqE/SkfB family [[Clostridium] polysaccharolyticum]
MNYCEEIFFNYPISIIWELTNSCLSRCIYCSGGFADKDKTKELSTEEKKKLVKELINNKIFAINLSGGEPFLCNDLEWIVDELTNNEIQVLIATTGLVYKEELLRKLCSNPFVSFNISLDSFNVEINDLHRGCDGTVDQVEKFIQAVNKFSNGRIFVALECVLTQKNIESIDEYIEKVKKLSVSEIRFQSVVTMNQATFNQKLSITEEQRIEAEKKVEQWNSRITDKHINFVDQSNTIEVSFRKGRNWGGILSPEGDLMVSVYLPYLFGNIRDEGSLKAAWDKGFSRAWLNSKTYDDIEKIHTVTDIEALCKKYEWRKLRL